MLLAERTCNFDPTRPSIQADSQAGLITTAQQ